MTNPPKEITTPPEGYEWTGEYRHALAGEYYAHFRFGAWAWQRVPGGMGDMEQTSASRYPILRKVKPPTVLVELPRPLVEYIIAFDEGHGGRVTAHMSEGIVKACRKALENEND